MPETIIISTSDILTVLLREYHLETILDKSDIQEIVTQVLDILLDQPIRNQEELHAVSTRFYGLPNFNRMPFFKHDHEETIRRFSIDLAECLLARFSQWKLHRDGFFNYIFKTFTPECDLVLQYTAF